MASVALVGPDATMAAASVALVAPVAPVVDLGPVGEVGEPDEDVVPVDAPVVVPPGVVPVPALWVVFLEVLVSLASPSRSSGPPTESRPHSS